MLLHMVFDCISLLTTDDTLHQWMMQFAHQHQKPKKKDDFRRTVDLAMNESVQIINSKGWKEESRVADGVVYSKSIPNIGKVFKYEGIVDLEAERMNNKLFYNVEQSPEWNRNVEKVNVVQSIDNQTNVVHFISKDRFFISSRDFVHLRSWKRMDNSIVHSSLSIDHPKVPPGSYIRAEHRFCSYVMRPLKEDPSKTHLSWVMQVNFKGWLPTHITDYAVTYGMFDHVSDIRSFQRH